MSYTSNYNLNQRISYLESIIAGLIPILPIDLANVLLQGNSAGASDIDMNNNDILNVDNIDLSTINGSAYPPVIASDTLQDVLTAGNEADLNVILKDDLITPLATTTIQPTSIAFNTTSGAITGSYTGNSNTIGYDGVGSGAGSGGITSSISNQSGTIVSVLAGGVANIPTPPYPASDAQFYLSVNSSTRNPQLLFQNSAPFENSTSMTLDLNGLIHNQGTGSPSPNTDFTISTNKNLILTADNVDLSSTGRLIVPSLASDDYLDYNAGTLTLKSNNVGYLTDELLLLENTNTTAGNTTGVPSIEMFKSGRNGAVNDVVSCIQFNAKDGAGVKRSFGRIESTITTNTAPLNYDGALDFYSLINGVNNLVFRLNGADNENNSFRPLDLNGNPLKTSALDLTIDATTSTGTGNITLNPKSTGSVIVNGNATMPSVSNSYKVGDISTQQGTLGATFVGFNDSVGVLASSLSNTTMTITNGTTNQQTQLTTNQLYINDTQNNKSITINNDAGGGNQNRIDLYKNQGGGIYNQSGIVNDTSTQNIFLLYQDNAVGRSLNIDNNSASGGVIEYSDQIGLQPFNITNYQGSLTLNAPTAGQPIQFNSDIINLQNTNTTTAVQNHTSSLGTTSNIGDITTYLKFQLNGTEIFIPYFTQDPSI